MGPLTGGRVRGVAHGTITEIGGSRLPCAQLGQCLCLGGTRALKKFAFLARVSSGGAGTLTGEKMRQGRLGYFADMIVSPLLAGGLSTFALPISPTMRSSAGWQW